MIRKFFHLERQVGLCISLFFIYLLVFSSFSSNGISNYFFIFFAASAALIAVFRSQWLRTLSILWMRLGDFISKLLNPLLILLTYCLSILPTALLLKLFNIKLMDKEFDHNVTSYWKTTNGEEQDMTLQF